MSVSQDYIEYREAVDYSNAVRKQKTKDLVKSIKVSRRSFEPIWLVRDPDGCLFVYYGFKPKKFEDTDSSHKWLSGVDPQLRDRDFILNIDTAKMCPFVKAEDSEPTRVVINKNGEFVNDVKSKLDYLKEKIMNEISTLDLNLSEHISPDKLANVAINAIINESKIQ